MKPPAPVTTTRSFLDMRKPFKRVNYYTVFSTTCDTTVGAGRREQQLEAIADGHDVKGPLGISARANAHLLAPGSVVKQLLCRTEERRRISRVDHQSGTLALDQPRRQVFGRHGAQSRPPGAVIGEDLGGHGKDPGFRLEDGHDGVG